MEFRSSNVTGFVHFQGDVVSNVSSASGSSHGVQLTGGSTGGIVQPAGDEASIGLNIRAKAAGPLNLGTSTGGAVNINSSGTVTITSTRTVLGSTFLSMSSGSQLQVGSTFGFAGFIRFLDTAVATPNFATTNAMIMETTHVIAGVSSQVAATGEGWLVFANPQNLSTDCMLVNAYVGSTAGDVHCRFLKTSTVTVSATTGTVNFLIVRWV